MIFIAIVARLHQQQPVLPLVSWYHVCHHMWWGEADVMSQCFTCWWCSWWTEFYCLILELPFSLPHVYTIMCSILCWKLGKGSPLHGRLQQLSDYVFDLMREKLGCWSGLRFHHWQASWGNQVAVHQTGWLSQQNHTSHFVFWSSSCLGNHRDTGAHCAWLLWSFSSCLQVHCPTTQTVTAPTAERPPPLSGGGILKASTCAMPVVSTTVSMAPTETTPTRRRWG